MTQAAAAAVVQHDESFALEHPIIRDGSSGRGGDGRGLVIRFREHAGGQRLAIREFAELNFRHEELPGARVAEGQLQRARVLGHVEREALLAPVERAVADEVPRLGEFLVRLRLRRGQLDASAGAVDVHRLHERGDGVAALRERRGFGEVCFAEGRGPELHREAAARAAVLLQLVSRARVVRSHERRAPVNPRLTQRHELREGQLRPLVGEEVVMLRVERGRVVDFRFGKERLRLGSGHAGVAILHFEARAGLHGLGCKAHAGVVERGADGGVQLAASAGGAADVVFHGGRNVQFFQVSAKPHARAAGGLQVILRAGVDGINRPVITARAARALGDEILPAERIQRRVMLEVEAVAEMKRLAGQHLQRALNVVGVSAALRVVADRQRALRGEAVLHTARGPRRLHRLAAAARDGRGPLAVRVLERALVREVPMRIPCELRFVAGAELGEDAGVFLVMQLEHRLIAIENKLPSTEECSHREVRRVRPRRRLRDGRGDLQRDIAERRLRPAAHGDADRAARQRKKHVVPRELVHAVHAHGDVRTLRADGELVRRVEFHRARHHAHVTALRPFHERDNLIPVRELDTIPAVRARAQHETGIESAVAESRVGPSAPALAEEVRGLRCLGDGDAGGDLRGGKLLGRAQGSPLVTGQGGAVAGDGRAFPVSGVGRPLGQRLSAESLAAKNAKRRKEEA